MSSQIQDARVTASDEDHVAKLRDVSRAFMQAVPHNQALGIEVVELSDACAVMRLPYDAKLVGDPRTGVLHGGAISALLDACSGSAVFMALPLMAPIATLDLRIDYLKPATPKLTVWARASCYRLTRSVGFTRCVAYHEHDQDRPIASAVGTFMRGTLNRALDVNGSGA